MATPLEMPKLGNTVEECFLTTWHKHKGDAVTAGDVIADIETDKATFELTAPTDGVLLETFFEEGALVPVFTTLCVIGAAGESVEGFRPSGAGPANVVADGHDADSAAGASGGEPQARTTAVDVDAAPVISTSPVTSDRLSPRARRFSREHEFNPAAIVGTGPGGRVIEADLRRLRDTPSSGEAVADAPSAGGSTAPSPGGEPLSVFRATIAHRVTEGLHSTAQYTLNGSANAGQLLTLRRRCKAGAATAAITIGDLVVFCAVHALLEAPDVNAELIDGKLHRHERVHIGFACDTPRGLMVPVVRDAQTLSIGALSARIRQLADQAVSGAIALDDLSGGTFTITNLGSLGIESFTPVLNPPQVAILGVDAIQPKPVRKPDGNIEFIDAIGLSLTVDHQLIDGAPGARFLAMLRDKIERVASLCTI